jgi:hypothetical protein
MVGGAELRSTGEKPKELPWEDTSRFSKDTLWIHRKKRFTSFPSPAGMSLTKLPLGRNNSVMTSLFPPRESLVVTSRLGMGNSRTFFYGVPAVINGYIERAREVSKITKTKPREEIFNGYILYIFV